MRSTLLVIGFIVAATLYVNGQQRIAISETDNLRCDTRLFVLFASRAGNNLKTWCVAPA
jgi:hypothetical protein